MNGSTRMRTKHSKGGANNIEGTDDESDDNCQRPNIAMAKVSCIVKCFHCLMGSATYRDIKQQGGRNRINSVSCIDQVSRFFFPLAFFGFHVFYWMTYVNVDTFGGLFNQM